MHDIARHRSFLAEIRGLIKLIRPKQWVKNSFVFAPLIFAGQFLKLNSIYSTFLAAFLFCLAASAVYIVNDLQDIDKDRAHPEKCKKRPLASGQVSPKSAIVLLVLIYIALGFAWFVAPKVIDVILVYLLLNWVYTFKLKHEPVIEIFIVAFGFVLRVYAGAVALAVPVSHWMFITTLSISLYLASIKRRQELVQNGSQGRGVLAHYSVSLIDRFVVLDRGKRSSRCQVLIDPDMVKLFAGDHYSKFIWDKYRKLSPTCRRLFDYFATHKEPFPLGLETFRQLCGSDSARLRKWREQVWAVCVELQSSGLVTEAWIDKDLIYCSR